MIKLEHIDNLSKWKKSWSNIGSRSISHRLRNYERIKYELAIKNNYLEIDIKDRLNLINLWEKICFLKKIDNIVLYKNMFDTKIMKNWEVIFFWDLNSAKSKIKEIVWNYF